MGNRLDGLDAAGELWFPQGGVHETLGKEPTMKTKSIRVSLYRSIVAVAVAAFVFTSALAQKLTVNSADYPTLGNPTSAI
jgi:hypothetical protein